MFNLVVVVVVFAAVADVVFAIHVHVFLSCFDHNFILCLGSMKLNLSIWVNLQVALLSKPRFWQTVCLLLVYVLKWICILELLCVNLVCKIVLRYEYCGGRPKFPLLLCTYSYFVFNSKITQNIYKYDNKRGKGISGKGYACQPQVEKDIKMIRH